MEYYKLVNRFTKITDHKWIIEQLKLDFDYLYAVVKSILIHPMEARSAKVKYDHQNSGIFHCLNSTVNTMLKYERLRKYLEEKRLPLSTQPNDRAVLSCDHHALLFASLVRHLGKPVRVRTGYCTYIVDGLTVPHWVTEVYNEEKKKWIIMDPERQLINVDRAKFLFASEVWRQHMETGRQFSSYSGLSGRQGLKYALLCDMNCIFKNELLSYEWRYKAHNRKKPDIVRTSFERLSEERQNDINSIAEMMLNPEGHMAELWQIYGTIVEPQDLSTSGFKVNTNIVY